MSTAAAVMAAGPGTEGHPLDPYVPSPRTGTFVVAATGTGKSTLVGALLERYHALHPRHTLYLVDSKGRYLPTFDRETADLFPYGYRESVYGKRERVKVQASMLEHPGRYRWRDERVFIVPLAAADELFRWLMDHPNVREPSLTYVDEAVDMMRGTRCIPSLRRLIQQGRELGHGWIIGHQRPAWVDKTFASEAKRIFGGSLYEDADRDWLVQHCRLLSLRSHLREPLPLRRWASLDLAHPERSTIIAPRLTRAGR